MPTLPALPLPSTLPIHQHSIIIAILQGYVCLQAPREMSAMAKAGYGANEINPGLLLVEKIYNYIQVWTWGGCGSKAEGEAGGNGRHF